MRAQHPQRDSSHLRWSDKRCVQSVAPARSNERRQRARAVCGLCGHAISEEQSRRVDEHLERQANAIAQALHDESGQLLTAAHLALAEASSHVSGTARQRLADVRTCLDQIEEQLRRIAHEGRPRLLEGVGLVPALEYLAESVEKRRGFAITIDAQRRLKLPPAVETTVYRVVQEGLNNIARHARATSVHVRVRRLANVVHCTIQDDGVGFDVDRVVANSGEVGLGLVGIRERVSLLGGRVDVRSARGRGTNIIIAIPLID